MDCEGEIEADVSLTIGNNTVSTKYRFNVVKNLCNSIIVGLGLLKKFKLIINTGNKMPLSFQKGIFKSKTGI